MATIVINVPVACNRGADSPGGLNLRDDSLGFGGRFSPAMKNMIVEPTRVRKRLGYSKVGANLPLTGAGTGLFEYVDSRGGKHLLAATTLAVYEYDATQNLWTELSTPTALTGDVDNTFRSAIVTDPALFAANGGSALILSNNVNAMIAYEGAADSHFETYVHNYASLASCVDVQEFWNHVVLLGPTTSSYYGKLLAWADFADADDWTGGTSGSSTLTDSVGVLQRGLKLGAYLVLYSERSISVCQYGNADVVFVVPTLVYGTGLLCSDAVWGDATNHRFVGSDGKLWRYDGGSLLYRVGELVEDALFQQLNYSLKQRVRVGYNQLRQKFMVAFPRASDSYAKAVYAQTIGLPGEPWEYYELADDIVAIASLEAVTGAYCDDFNYALYALLGVDGDNVLGVADEQIVLDSVSTESSNPWANRYCDEVAVYCDDSLGATSSTPVCVFESSDSYVYKFDEATGYDDDAVIECSYETEDVTIDAQHSFARWLWFSFTAKSLLGGTVEVSYSTDGGESWEALADSPKTLTANWTPYRLPLSPASERIRFRLKQPGYGDLQLRGLLRIAAEPATARA